MMNIKRYAVLLLLPLSMLLLLAAAQADDSSTTPPADAPAAPETIKPQGSARMPVDDSAIIEQVKREFRQDAQLVTESINVDSNQGVVTLSGNLSSGDRIARAVQFAANVPGVKSIRNMMTTSP